MEEKRNGRLVGAAEIRKEHAEWLFASLGSTSNRLQRKNLNILDLLKRRDWHQCHRERSWQVRKSRLFQKEKEQSRLSRAPDRELGESQGKRKPHLGEKEGGSERDHGEERMDSIVKKGRFQ